MAWDESVYRDPHEFRPERFMGPDAEPLPVEFAFGFGRRYVTFTSVQCMLLTLVRAESARGVILQRPAYG